MGIEEDATLYIYGASASRREHIFLGVRWKFRRHGPPGRKGGAFTPLNREIFRLRRGLSNQGGGGGRGALYTEEKT